LGEPPRKVLLHHLPSNRLARRISLRHSERNNRTRLGRNNNPTHLDRNNPTRLGRSNPTHLGRSNPTRWDRSIPARLGRSSSRLLLEVVHLAHSNNPTHLAHNNRALLERNSNPRRLVGTSVHCANTLREASVGLETNVVLPTKCQAILLPIRLEGHEGDC
jgi:hypothetical protein